MAKGQGDSSSETTSAEAHLQSEKLRLEVAKLKLENDVLRQNRRPLQKIASSATAISAMVAVVAAVTGVVLSSAALLIQSLSFTDDRRHKEQEEISSIIEKLTEKDASPQRRMGLVWALRQYWWGDNSEVLSNALGTLILNDNDPNVIQAAGLAFGRIFHDNPYWPKAKRVLYGSATEEDRGAILRFNLDLRERPTDTELATPVPTPTLPPLLGRHRLRQLLHHRLQAGCRPKIRLKRPYSISDSRLWETPSA